VTTRRLAAPLLLSLAALACATSRPPAPVEEAAAPSPAPAPVEAAPAPVAEPPASQIPAELPAPPAGTASPAPEGLDRSRPPPLGPSVPLRLPEQRHFALSNGLKVRLVEYHRLPVVALDLTVDAGGARDPASLPGTASFTAAMLTEGTRSRTATQISDEVGLLGADLGASAGPDSSTLSGACLAEHLPALLDVFADVAAHPAFPAEDFDRVKDERRVALLQQRDQPPVLAARAFIGAFWGSSPYGHPLLGNEPALERTRIADLARFHERYWVATNAELVVVGDVTEAELRPLLERSLGSWAAGRPAPALPAHPPAAPHRTLLVDKPGAPQSYAILGAPGLDRRSPDFVAATVMLEVLGGGSNSRLFRSLREEKGYTYGIYAGADSRRLAGASVVRGTVRADVTGAALKDLLGELSRMRDQPVSGDELAEAKDSLVRSLPAEFATAAGIAGHLAELIVHGLPDDYWNGYALAVEAVTAADVQRAARRYLAPGRTTLVLVGAKELVRPQLTGLPIGPVELHREVNPLLPRKHHGHPRPAAGGAEDASTAD
jgi:zinc protease